MNFQPTPEQERLTGEIFDWRHKRGSAYMEHPMYYSYSGNPGTGKAQPDDTLIPMLDGYARLDSLVVGDMIYGPSGQPTKVLGIYPQGNLFSYEIIFEDGRHTECSADHLWTVYDYNGNLITLTLQDIRKDYTDHTYHIPITKPIEYKERELTVPPLTMGRAIYHGFPYCSDPKFKHGIPDEYLYNTIKNRFELLRGIFDSTVDSSNVAELIADCTQNPIRVDTLSTTYDILTLARGLGLYAAKTVVSYHGNIEYEISIKAQDKLAITEIVALREKPMRCIKVDNTQHLYLTYDFIVTHNTTILATILDMLHLTADDYICAAYTGKAVLNLLRKGLPACTIHSLIYDVVFEPIKEKGSTKTKYKISFVLKSELAPSIKLIIIDEATMVNDKMRDELISFGIPIIFVGDADQLPPVFGISSVMLHPDFRLTQIMRQAEDDPIVILSQRILHGQPLYVGKYGLSKVVDSYEVDQSLIKDYDILICAKNATRDMLNRTIREDVLGITNPDPVLRDKIMCRQNDWGVSVNGIFLTNGLIGYIENISRAHTHKGFNLIDFRPDFMEECFEDLQLDIKYIRCNATDRKAYGFSKFNKFEFGYAITAHTSQGSEWPRVFFMDESFWDQELTKKVRYTAITRAEKAVTIVSQKPQYQPFYY